MTENRPVQSVGTQAEILSGILRLQGLDKFEVDLTYGNGMFYKKTGIPAPDHRFDLDDTLPDLTNVCSSTNTPLEDASVGSVVFDPPFLTYIRSGRGGNGGMVMARRFAGYWRYDELEDHYGDTLRETSRILHKGGVMVFKCQDIVHNHRLHPTHASVIGWAAKVGMRLKDLYILPAAHRMPSPNRNGTQRHSRIHHSYFLVLEKQ